MTSTNLAALLGNSRAALEAFARRNGIRRVSFFGSVLTPQFDESSDVDMLVEFLPGRVPGLVRLAAMEIELSTILGRKVDLNTSGFLHPRFREQVLESAVVYFEAA
jgi:uncharacterized protein